MRGTATPRGRLLLGLGALPLVLAACGSGPAKTTTSSTLPPLPPTTVGYVTLIGSASNLGSGNGLEAINLSEGAGGSTRTFTVGTFPDAAAVTPDGKTLYVTNYASNTVTPIAVATGTVEKAIPVGAGPAGIAIAPNGKTAYVTDAGSSPIGDTVTPINLKTHKALAPITVGGGPQGIVITPDGATAYVANAGGIVTGQNAPLGHTVTPIDLKSGKAGAPITVGNAPTALAMTPDGATVYVANTGSGSVTPLTVAGNSAGVPITVNGSPQALAATATTVYVADDSASSTAGNNVTPIALSSGSAGTPIVTGANPTGLAISPDRKTAYVVCNGTGKLESLDLTSNTVLKTATVSVPGGAYAIALAGVPAAELASAFGVKPAKKKAVTG
ncbi:MAG TPA: YncE family protein [Acidimicrobiales bacterium]|nr:YncE family protein [Acidimicrobiales bacterium]